MPPAPRPLASEGSYLLLSNWTVHLHEGRLWTRPLWTKDLEQHLRYIDRVTLACPVAETPPFPGASAIQPEIAARIRLVPMHSFPTRKERVVRAIPYAAKVLGLLRSTSILHFTAASHPILYGLIVPWVRRRRRVGIVGVVESSFWRKPRAGKLQGWISRLAERSVKRAVSNAHVTFLTQESYLKELTDPANSNHVVSAVWVDEANFVQVQELDAHIESKTAALRDKVRIGYFGQLLYDKGPDVLVEAARILSTEGFRLQVDIFGLGPEQDRLLSLAQGLEEIVRFRGFVKYGPDFFREMRACHALALPTRSDERPRVMTDCFSQAVPILASSAPGMDLVRDGETGLRFESGNALELARAIRELASDPDRYRRLSRNAIESVRQQSHSAMHRYRSQELVKAFPASPRLVPFR